MIWMMTLISKMIPRLFHKKNIHVSIYPEKLKKQFKTRNMDEENFVHAREIKVSLSLFQNNRIINWTGYRLFYHVCRF